MPRFQYIRGGVSVSMLFFDTTSCLFATVRAWRTRKDFESASLTAIVFSQGLTYIAPTFCLSVASIVLIWRVEPEVSRLMNVFKLPLAGLLTARFLLRLRKWEASTWHDESSPRFSGLRFATQPAISENPGTANGSKNDAQASLRSVLGELAGDIGPRSYPPSLY
ncbi:hypothetical protein BKA70DRAFT_1437507 [Coprinopsis sp. MPI-PUGE-AT-0042]|nr:hypothetical protein BKA70DRAFT_1437507 [Coprinopsis sp. MPI-PUGE-AT-0042]